MLILRDTEAVSWGREKNSEEEKSRKQGRAPRHFSLPDILWARHAIFLGMFQSPKNGDPIVLSPDHTRKKKSNGKENKSPSNTTMSQVFWFYQLGRQCKLATLKRFVILPPTQHHSFFRNLPPLSPKFCEDAFTFLS